MKTYHWMSLESEQKQGREQMKYIKTEVFIDLHLIIEPCLFMQKTGHV